jgi:colanic acid/amylovoran biosynthesis protein
MKATGHSIGYRANVEGRPVRVLVLWSDQYSANLGVQVLANGATEFARRIWGDRTIVDHQDFGPGEGGIAFAGKPVVRDLLSRTGPIREKLRTYDVLLDTGAGDSFTDIYGLKRLSWMINVHRIASSLRVPIVLTPQTIGPFDTRIGRMAARYALSRSHTVIARDRISFDASSVLGRRPDGLATDMVFLLSVPDAEKSRDVILNISGLLWEPNSHVDNQMYRAAAESLAKKVIDSGRKLTLLAHVLENRSRDSDLSAVRELAGRLDGAAEVAVPSGLDDARSVIATSRVVVGARMHACLNALSVGVPTVPWAYSRKFKPLFDDLGWRHTLDLRDNQDLSATTYEKLSSQSIGMMRADLRGVTEAAAARLAGAIELLAPTKQRH